MDISQLAPARAVGHRTRAATYFERDGPDGIVAAFLHGNTARGARRQESDVDIGVLVNHTRYPDRKERSRLRVRLAADLPTALGTNDVDVVVLNDVPPGLATRIVLDGTLLMARDRVSGPESLETDLSLHNDVLFSLLTVAQVVIDVAGELSAREGHRFENYTTAVRNLARLEGFSREMVAELARLPGFRNILVHEYVGLDYELVLEALDHLAPVEAFLAAVLARLEEEDRS